MRVTGFHVVAALVLLAGCSSTPEGITNASPVSDSVAESLSWDEWPLEVTEGEIECWDDGSVTFATQGGARYALNGHARGQSERWPDVLDITKPGEGVDGTTMALLDLVFYATQTVCTDR